jgi:hypothetical protein
MTTTPVDTIKNHNLAGLSVTSHERKPPRVKGGRKCAE